MMITGSPVGRNRSGTLTGKTSLVMLSCYLDESTAHGEPDPSTCVAGYMATGKQWAKFARAWGRMCEHYGIEIFHAKEFETEEGRKRSVFKRWSKKKRKELQNDIINVIVGSGLMDVGAAIPHSAFKAVMTPERIKRFGKDPDGLCALLAMMSATAWASDQKAVYKQAPSFFCERGARYKTIIEWAHNYLATESKVHQEFFRLSTLTFAPKSKDYPQLQAADFLAFNMSKRCSHILDLNPPADAPLESLADGRKVRRTRYPLMALYSMTDSHVRYCPTPEHLEKALRLIEDDEVSIN